MNTQKRILIISLVLSLVLHFIQLKNSIVDIVQIINRLIILIDKFSILLFITYSINILTVLTGSIGMFLLFRNKKIINNWLLAFIIIENFRTVTTIPSMLILHREYFPSISQVGFLYYLYLVAMTFTLISSINYFSRLANFERTYSEIGDIKLTSSRRIRFTNYIIDFLLIAGVSFDKFYILKQSIELRYVFVLCFVIYYFSSEALYGRTLGKAFTKTTLIKTNNFSVKILIRTLARLIPFEQLSFLSNKTHGWHDNISKTYLHTLK